MTITKSNFSLGFHLNFRIDNRLDVYLISTDIAMIPIICGLLILSKLLKSMTKRVSREVIMIMLSYIIGISLTFFGISNQHEVNLQKFESCFFYVYKQNDPHCHLRHKKALHGT